MVNMSSFDARTLATGWLDYTPRGDRTVLSLFAPDFYDNVSGRGLDILDVVAQ